ncbi:MAG: hypothetical protein KAI08_05880, partial [Bacteroidales bacterium]|nr:hypothetical protein [Bacteroidales bacterium]
MRSVLIIFLLALFIIGMDLYALRGIQHLFSPGRNGNPLFYYLFWGVSLLILLTLIVAGTRFQK